MRFFLSIWPGSLAAWRHGDPRSVLMAISFGILVSLGWTATMIWPMWLSPYRLATLWSIVALATTISMIHSIASGLLRSQERCSGCPDATLVAAQALYLQANYFEAEQAIAPYCRIGMLDAEAALLMACILRRTGRFSQALTLLDEVSLLDCGLPWSEEIECEKKRSRQEKVRSLADGT